MFMVKFFIIYMYSFVVIGICKDKVIKGFGYFFNQVCYVEL